MLTFLLLQVAAPVGQPAPGVHPEVVVEGRGSPTATIPRVEDAEVRIDGRLDEPVWAQATRLTGFWQYQPVDGRPAEEETEVLVWYAPDAIHFGIIAHDRSPAAIRATVADRDNIDNDDHIVLDLDTFHDRRRAFFFGVNPLGVAERRRAERGRGPGRSLIPGGTDLNPDFTWESKGRITDRGYEVEIRIPFKSLRYPGERRAELGLQRHPGGPAHRLHRHLDRRAAGQRQLPGAGRRDRRPARPPARGDGGGAAVRHRHRRRQSRRRQRRVHPRGREPRRRAQPPARLHQLRPRRHASTPTSARWRATRAR